MLRNKTEIHCDNCGAEIEEPKNIYKLTFFGIMEGRSKLVRSMICPRCAEEFAEKFHALLN